MRLDNNAAVWRLKAVVEADASALVRVLHFFQARNLVPRRVFAKCAGAEFLEIEIELDAAHVAREVFAVIAAKIKELPIVVAAVVCDD